MTPRQLARIRGVPQYNTGKVCRSGHTSPRYTSNGVCVACMAANKPLYRENTLASNLLYQRQNRALCYARRDKWNSEHPDRLKEYRARHRAAKKHACPSWVNRKVLRQIYRECPEDFHVDHIVPLQGKVVCGLHVPWNLQYLAASDNISKGNKFA